MIEILDVLKKTVKLSEDGMVMVSLCERGGWSCEMVRFVEDEFPHQLPAGSEHIIFTSGSGLIIVGDVVERIVLDLYTIGPGIVYSVIPDKMLEGFIFLPKGRSVLEREYYRDRAPDKRFFYAFWREITSFKRAIALRYLEEVVDLHNPHVGINWATMPSLTDMIKQLG